MEERVSLLVSLTPSGRRESCTVEGWSQVLEITEGRGLSSRTERVIVERRFGSIVPVRGSSYLILDKGFWDENHQNHPVHGTKENWSVDGTSLPQ